jgi:hypothetical protein
LLLSQNFTQIIRASYTKANLLLLISYSLCELHHFAAQSTVFTAKQKNSKPSFFYAAAAAGACALITAHLCRRQQRFTPNTPSRVVERTRSLLAQRQTPLLLIHLDDVVLPPPTTRLMYPFAVLSAAAPPLSL